MVDRARISEFWSHWNHEPDESQEFERFRIRMTEVARKLWTDYFKDDIHLRERFAIISGTSKSPHPYFEQSGLCYLLEQAKNLFEMADALQRFLWTLERLSEGRFDYCCDEIERALDLSPTIMIRLARYDKTATLYPMGARLLDEAVVESNLIWLARYPEVLKHFEQALKLYMTKDPNQYRNMLDSLRFALEQMLRVVLNNEKSLENQKDEFLRWLKQHDAHGRIGNMYHQLLFVGFADYQNAAVKHQEDKYTPAEVEFILYATGTFLRLIQRLVEQESAVVR